MLSSKSGHFSKFGHFYLLLENTEKCISSMYWINMFHETIHENITETTEMSHKVSVLIVIC